MLQHHAVAMKVSGWLYALSPVPLGKELWRQSDTRQGWFGHGGEMVRRLKEKPLPLPWFVPQSSL